MTETSDQEPFEIGGVRMFFVKDPDGTPVEFIELPGGVRSTYEMHRGVPLQMGPADDALHPPRLDARPRRDRHRRRPGRRQGHRHRTAGTRRVGAAGRHPGREAGATTDELEAAGRVEKLVANLRDPDSAQRIVAAAVDAFGTVHGLVNNAIATNEPKAFVDITAEDLALGYDVGPRATFLLMQAVHPVMVEAGGGSIVNLGSGTGTGGEPKWGGYAAAKEAIRGLSKVAALEWGRDNIRVNVICPFAESDGVKFWKSFAPDDYAKAVGRVPMKRIGDVRTDVGALVAFLLSSDATVHHRADHPRRRRDRLLPMIARAVGAKKLLDLREDGISRQKQRDAT